MKLTATLYIKAFVISALMFAFCKQGFSQHVGMALRKHAVAASTADPVAPNAQKTDVAVTAEENTGNVQEPAKTIHRLQIYHGAKTVDRSGRRLPIRRRIDAQRQESPPIEEDRH